MDIYLVQAIIFFIRVSIVHEAFWYLIDFLKVFNQHFSHTYIKSCFCIIPLTNLNTSHIKVQNTCLSSLVFLLYAKWNLSKRIKRVLKDTF